MYQFLAKTNNFDFFGPNLPKKKLGFEIQKINVGIRISILQIPCVPIFRQNGQLWTSWTQISQKNEFWGQNFKNLSLSSESESLRYYVYQFSDKTNNFEFLASNLPKNRLWGWNFQNLGLNSESTSLMCHMCPFSVKMDNF